jgi:NitT/TauT family transport system ATP-binding protein
VSLDGVRVQFGTTSALGGVTMNAEGGALTALIGPSGCGKSTLLRVVAGLVHPSAGQVLVGTRPPDQVLDRHACGFMFQTPLMLPWLDLIDNVALAGRLVGLTRAERHARARAWIGRVGLGDFERHRPHELSGGMRQRAALARALTLSPVLLLMDEPFGALDELTRRKLIFEVIATLADRQPTVLLVTHSIEEAILMSDRIVVMTAHPGRVKAVVDNDLPRPRSPESQDLQEFSRLARQLRELLADEELAL